MNRQSIKRLTKYVLLGYFIYIFLTAVVMFTSPFQTKTLATDIAPPWIDETEERVVFVEDRVEALKVRLDLMNHAEEKLDISYYSLQGGDSVELFLAQLIKTADRGVQVRFVVDGIAHNMRFNNRQIINTFTKHPNIELVFYEPLDLVRPWTWHNRLHDKVMIADESIALIGGRNIGDKYFAPEGYDGASNDYDLLLFNADGDATPIVDEMQIYFDYLWEHDYSVIKTDRQLSEFGERGADSMNDRLMGTHQDYLEMHPALFSSSIDWVERSHEIERGFYVHNSGDRFQKEPLVWRQMLSLVANAETEVVMQSPYIIPSHKMRKELAEQEFNFERGMMLTNGMASTPNVLAHSGYRNYRNKLADSSFDLYEYQDSDQSLHMKALVIDRQIAAVGSFNLDARSMNLNSESMVVLDSPSLAAEIMTTIDQKYMPDSIKVNGAEDGAHSIEDPPLLKRILVIIMQPLVRVIDFLL